MKTKRLGRTGLMVTENSFGALPIQRLSVSDASALLRAAYDAGINFFDTAHGYTDSEEKIGAALSDVRSHIYLATKAPAKTRTGVLEQAALSLSRMKTDYVDLLQLHNIGALPDVNDPESAHYGLLEAREKGMCRFIGITTHRLDVALAAAKSGLYDTVQFPLSYISADDDLALIDVCAAHDIGLIAMKALAGGLISSADAAFAFFADKPAVPIWGMQKQAELQDFLRCARDGVTMTPALQEVMEQDRARLTGNFCRGCGYCAPCPAGIDISLAARMTLMLNRAPWREFTTPAHREMMVRIDNCIGCGACKSRCPYQLDCPSLLRENYTYFKEFVARKDAEQNA